MLKMVDDSVSVSTGGGRPVSIIIVRRIEYNNYDRRRHRRYTGDSKTGRRDEFHACVRWPVTTAKQRPNTAGASIILFTSKTRAVRPREYPYARVRSTRAPEPRERRSSSRWGGNVRSKKKKTELKSIAPPPDEANYGRT